MQVAVADRRRIASVGFTIFGSGRSSTPTSRGLYLTATRTTLSSIVMLSWVSEEHDRAKSLIRAEFIPRQVMHLQQLLSDFPLKSGTAAG